MQAGKSAAGYVLSRLPRDDWLTEAQIAEVARQAGVDAAVVPTFVRTWRRKGAVVTNSRKLVMRRSGPRT
uniref:hypothetical protein n=1 Tax=Streptomyces sp. CA-136453 TaxID=3240050 RepID=UPI003F4918AA